MGFLFQARILEWVAISFSSGPSRSRDQIQFSCITGWFFTYWTTRGVSETGKYLQMLEVLVAQLCPTLCNPMDCCLPASSALSVFQARILEWVAAIPFSKGSSLLQGIFPAQGSNLGLLHCRQILYHLNHQESKRLFIIMKIWEEISNCTTENTGLKNQYNHW